MRGLLRIARVVAAGVGVTPIVAAGPRLAEALPLHRLAGNDGQPLLLRMWLAAGTLLSWLRARWAGLWASGTALILISGSTAASDALTECRRVLAYLGPALDRPTVWCAAVCFGAGASARLLGGPACARRRSPSSRRDPGPAGPPVARLSRP